MIFKSKTDSQEPVKRGRGRPRKYPVAETSTPTINTQKTPKTSRKNLVIVLVVILALIPSAYFYNKSRTQTKDSVTQIQEVQKKVGKHILLPTGETPSLIPALTQEQLNKLVSQTFFSQAKVGDEVLVYSRAGRAILYRPSIDRVVEMAPLNSSTTTPATGQ
jgi:hypothetical protein